MFQDVIAGDFDRAIFRLIALIVIIGISCLLYRVETLYTEGDASESTISDMSSRIVDQDRELKLVRSDLETAQANLSDMSGFISRLRGEAVVRELERTQ